MKNLIVANWKMNPQTFEEAEALAKKISESAKEAKGVDVVICPPFTWLTDLSHKKDFAVAFGAQDVFYEEKGAYTGEISPLMLENSNVRYVIVGHSERRKYFNETDEVVNKKVRAVLEAGLTPILCIGETAEERSDGGKNQVLERQIKDGLVGVEDSENMVIAYEPVWAIGTGNNCSVEETKDSIDFIKKFVPEGTRVIYGGSVKADNSGDYIKEAGANGLLVGGASLDAEEFSQIIKIAE